MSNVAVGHIYQAVKDRNKDGTCRYLKVVALGIDNAKMWNVDTGKHTWVKLRRLAQTWDYKLQEAAQDQAGAQEVSNETVDSST